MIAENPAIDLPLTGVRVLDLATGKMAGIARHLGELGADVIRVETSGGTADLELEFAAMNLGKRAVALDISAPDGFAWFETLLGEADILIENAGPNGTLDVASLCKNDPRLVILSVSDFGRGGDYANWTATGPVLHALTGELSRSGIPGRPPLLPPGDLAHDVALSQAVFVVLVAYVNRLRNGLGDWLDFSLLDAANQALDPGYGISGSATAGVPPSQLPRGRPEARHQYPIIPCMDGFVRLCILAPRQWQGMFAWMGQPEEFADPVYMTLQKRFSSPELIAAIARFFARKTRAEIESEAQGFGVPAAGLLTMDEVVNSEQVLARRVFRDVELAAGVKVPFPDGLMEIDGVRAGLRGGVPVAGDCAWGARPLQAVWGAADRPLAGVRVLDFGVIVVGAEQGRLLADQGADVIKVENAAFADGSRQTRDGSPFSVTFAAGHRNKRGLGLNLREPAGKALFLRLVEQSDVILSNFKPGTLESLGLGYEVMSAINERIIAVDSSAFGPTGPWSRRLGYGPLVRASAGLTKQWVYPGEPESFSDAITVYPDHVAGRIGAIGAVALLIRRLRTGRGGTASIAQAEVMLNHMAVPIAAASLGETQAEPDAPWGVYPAQGDDEWCVITVRGDTDFAALCRTIGREDWRDDPALTTCAGRVAARQRIDAVVAAWLAARPPVEAMAVLQAAGVPAAAMLRVSELPAFPYYRSRAFYQKVTHPWIANPFYLETEPVKSEHLKPPEQRPAPVIGGDSAEILREYLGISDEEIAALITGKVLEVANA